MRIPRVAAIFVATQADARGAVAVSRVASSLVITEGQVCGAATGAGVVIAAGVADEAGAGSESGAGSEAGVGTGRDPTQLIPAASTVI